MSKWAKNTPKKPQQTHCEKYGHYYRKTTSDYYKVCVNAGCKHAQRMLNGQWVDVASEPKPQREQRTATQPSWLEVLAESEVQA